MALGLTGSTLSDLAQARLMNDQIVGGEFANADLRTLQREQDRMRNNQLLQDLALRQRALDAETAYRNNALAQQAQIAQMQHTIPNATVAYGVDANAKMAERPYGDMTAFQRAQVDLQQQQLMMDADRYSRMLSGGGDGLNPLVANTRAGQVLAEGQVASDQRKAALESAVRAANATYRQMLPTFWQFGGWLRYGDFQDRLSNAVRDRLRQSYPEVDQLQFFKNEASPEMSGFGIAGEGDQRPLPQPSPTGGQFGQLPHGGSITNSVPTTVAPSMGGFNIGPYRFTPTAQPSPTGGQFNQFPPLDSPTAINPRRMFGDGATMSVPGPTATNPQTGERIQFINGRWQPIP